MMSSTSIISSILLHFTTLYLFFVFPTSFFHVIDTLFNPPPPSNTVVDHSIPSFHKSQLLYGLALLILNISFVSSVPNTIFCGPQRKLFPSLKSLISSFLPLLPTNLAYSITFITILSAFGIFTGLVFYVMILLGFEIEAATTCFAALVVVTMILFAVLFVYVCVEWKYGFEWSTILATGMRSVAFVMITMLAILQGILSALFSVLGGRAAKTSNVVVVQLVVYAALFTLLSLFVLAANTVLAFGESGEFDYFSIDEKKLSQIYVVDKI